MAEINPPLVIQDASHNADLLRQLWGDTYTAGVVAADHLEVTEQSTPALGVTVAAGRAVVAGDEAASQGVYYVSNDADRNVALATADATNDRIDLIVARIKDSFYSGGDDEWAIEAVTGTPAATPSPPAAPANSLILAEVTVPADAGGNPPITDSEIDDQREVSALRAPLVAQEIDFDAHVDGSNLGLSTSFQTGASLSYTPPSHWGTYKVQFEVWIVTAGLTSGDALQLVAQIDAPSGSAGGLTDDNAASTSRTIAAFQEAEGLSGVHTLDVRVRNSTAARGTVYTSWVRATAIRTS